VVTADKGALAALFTQKLRKGEAANHVA